MTIDKATANQFEKLILSQRLYSMGNTVYRGYLEENFKLEPTYDLKYPNKAYYFLPSIEVVKSYNPELFSFLKNANYLYIPFQRSSDTVLQFNKKTQLIFQNTSCTDAITYLKSNPEVFTHTLSIKTAEYHTYFELKDLSNNHTLSIGAAPKLKGSKLDYINLRNDSYYDPKYHIGHNLIHPNHLNPHFNKGSIAITFPITTENATKVLDLVRVYNNDFQNSDHRFDITGHIGHNCADIVNKIMNEIGIEGKISDYYKTDELDLRDQGIMYLLWSDLGTIKFAYHMPYHFFDNLAYASCGKGIDQLSEYWGSKLGYYSIFNHPISPLIPAAYNGDVSKIEENINHKNVANFAGETPLHIALQNGNFDFADKLLTLKADINLRDAKGQTPLNLAAGQKPSVMKNKILKDLCKLSSNVNAADNINIKTPLANAVLSDDPEAVGILIECGANVSYVNGNKDNIIDIAVFAGKFKTINLLHSKDANLIYHDNLEHQIPICEIAKQPDPNAIIDGFDELWSAYDQSNCKNHSQLNAHLDL